MVTWNSMQLMTSRENVHHQDVSGIYFSRKSVLKIQFHKIEGKILPFRASLKRWEFVLLLFTAAHCTVQLLVVFHLSTCES